jgi:hypothetical protein
VKNSVGGKMRAAAMSIGGSRMKDTEKKSAKQQSRIAFGWKKGAVLMSGIAWMSSATMTVIVGLIVPR